MKKLDIKALEICTDLKHKGLMQKAICEHLRLMGYTNPSGSPLNEPALSRFMRNNGLRYHESRKRPTRSNKE